jgi:hypothetical protein
VSLLDRFMGERAIAAIDVGDGTLGKLVAAITAPGELLWSVVRGDGSHGPWDRVMDPDTCPAVLLPWLAQFAGVELLPDDTEAQQRYRIRQAAGFYQGTPRALVEELQLVLSGTRTVLLGFHNGDHWHYAVGTLDDETPDAGVVAAAVARQNPAGMVWEHLLTSDWSYFVIAPDLIAHRETVDGVDSYVISDPTFPDYQSLVDTFSDYQHLLDNDPDL